MLPFCRYWGKADKDLGSTSGVSCHLAVLHMLDVAAVAERQVERSPALRKKFARMLALEEDHAAATVAAFVALHDVGKLDTRFQAKAPEAAASLGVAVERKLGIDFDHGAAGYGHLRRDHAPGVERELGQGAWPLLQAVTGHHGELPKGARAEGTARWADARWRNQCNADRVARAAYLAEVMSLFRTRGAALPISVEPTAPLVMQLAGLCSVADWIGSAAEYFPYLATLPPLASYYQDRALPCADEALSALSLRGARPSGKRFAGLFPNIPSPRDVQRVTCDLHLPDGPCLIVVEAQMGSGKTEAALELAERFLARGDASGLYFALPTMATSNAMLARIVRDVPMMFEGEVNVVLSHGRRAMNDLFRSIEARGGPAATHYDDEASVVCSRWLTQGRKRALLGQVGVGTVDQAMLAALRVRHHFVRVHALADSVVIIDEVHAYDAYMSVIIDRLVEWLGALGAPVILLSATLPAVTRQRLARAYAEGAGFRRHEESTGAAPYPFVTCVSAEGVSQHALAEPLAGRRVELEVIATATPEASLLPRLIEAARGGAMVAWVRNTVTEAQRAWDEARSLGANPLLFHARLRANDRAQIEDRVLAEYGKDGARTGALLIATQVVEQSLDLDFDLLASDLAPIDLVLQRAGRLHRHARERRPPGCEIPRLIVVAPAPGDSAGLEFGGSGHVYDKATLGLSLGLLQERDVLSIPDQIRGLVESLYDPAVRSARIATAPNTDVLRAAEERASAELEKRRQRARRVCIPPVAYDPVAAETYYDDDEEEIQALTRDGDSTTLLLVHWDGEEGRALEGAEAWVPDPNAADGWRLARELMEHTVSVPAYPWEQIERGARAFGEATAWEEWERRMHDFLSHTGSRATVVVPMRPFAQGWRGKVQTSRGEFRRVAYSNDKGLWFREGDE